MPSADSALVRVKDYIPDVFVDLKYATEHNFTGHRVYDFSDAYLRYGTVQKLKKAQEELRKSGLSLKIWDAYRPEAARNVQLVEDLLVHLFIIFNFTTIVLQQILYTAAEDFCQCKESSTCSFVDVLGTNFILL